MNPTWGISLNKLKSHNFTLKKLNGTCLKFNIDFLKHADEFIIKAYTYNMPLKINL